MNIQITALLFLFAAFELSAQKADFVFHTIDTDFSKGRLTHEQTLTLTDLEKFHGHICDGLVVGARAMEVAFKTLYPGAPIDRTNLRIVSKPSPCLTDVAVYLTGGRYQFNTFYVDTAFAGLFIVERMDDGRAVSVSLNKGVKPTAIDSLGNLAVNRELSPCEIDRLQAMENDFTHKMLAPESRSYFTVTELNSFNWTPKSGTFLKTDIVNKNIPVCE